MAENKKEIEKGCGKVWFGEDRLEHSCGFDILCEDCENKELK